MLASFYARAWPFLVAVVLLGAIGPALLRARGLLGLLLAATGMWLTFVMIGWVTAPPPRESLLTHMDVTLGLCIGLAVGAILRLRKASRWGVAAVMGALAAIGAIILVPVVGSLALLFWVLFVIRGM